MLQFIISVLIQGTPLKGIKETSHWFFVRLGHQYLYLLLATQIFNLVLLRRIVTTVYFFIYILLYLRPSYLSTTILFIRILNVYNVRVLFLETDLLSTRVLLYAQTNINVNLSRLNLKAFVIVFSQILIDLRGDNVTS